MSVVTVHTTKIRSAARISQADGQIKGLTNSATPLPVVKEAANAAGKGPCFARVKGN
ncbi:MAG: hypothetical protein QGI86_04030 [Candidatus Poribacteria bacterium]|nr:hypothetical protein [Candidatus Poribacteria bacterium]